ncbi:MAG: hypothetical protein ACC628_12960 [Pirellulaceae bacterium]
MAALAELPQTTYVREVDDELLTQNRTPKTAAAGKTRFPGGAASWRARTATGIEPIERGDESLRDRGDYGRRQRDVTEPATETPDAEAVRVRSEAARDILNRVNELKPMLGQVSFVTHLQLLKRDLSRAHDLLHNRPSETVFLSIVTLIESALSQTRWKDYTEEQLEVICGAADLGYRQPQVSYHDYERLRQEFAGERLDVRPRIDLDALDQDDLTDDEDQEA